MVDWIAIGTRITDDAFVGKTVNSFSVLTSAVFPILRPNVILEKCLADTDLISVLAKSFGF